MIWKAPVYYPVGLRLALDDRLRAGGVVGFVRVAARASAIPFKRCSRRCTCFGHPFVRVAARASAIAFKRSYLSLKGSCALLDPIL